MISWTVWVTQVPAHGLIHFTSLQLCHTVSVLFLDWVNETFKMGCSK